MTKTKAIRIAIAPGDARPIFRQIVDGIRKDIATGDIPHGSKLPSVRALAMQLTINPNTVSKAYAELTAQGLLESRKGLGVFVIEPEQRLSDGERQRQLEQATARFINDVMYLDFSADEISEHIAAELNKLANQ